MITKDAEYRVSVLLRLMGPKATSAVLAGLPSGRRQKLKELLGVMDDSPPSRREITSVVQEFDRLLRFASSQDEPDSTAEDGTTATAITELSEDPFEAVGQISEMRLMAALRDEAPRTTAVVLSCLDESKAARVLQQLPPELRDQTILQLKEQFTPSLTLLTRLLSVTVEKCKTFEDRQLSSESVDSDARVAKLLRTMEPERRGEVLEMLEEADPEAAERIRNALFGFDDLLIVAPRSMQKLLTEIDAQTLSLALKSASKELTARVLDNLSKRARESLTEEIALLGDVSKSDTETAEATIVKAMIELDKVGQLTMESADSGGQ